MNGTNIKRPNIAAAWSVTHREALRSLERQVDYDIAIKLQSFNKRELRRLVKEDIMIEPGTLGYEVLVSEITPHPQGALLECDGVGVYHISEITLENKIDLLEAIERII